VCEGVTFASASAAALAGRRHLELVTADEGAAIAEVKANRAAGVPRIPFDEVKRKHA
jgi:hypothetical protein